MVLELVPQRAHPGSLVPTGYVSSLVCRNPVAAAFESLIASHQVNGRYLTKQHGSRYWMDETANGCLLNEQKRRTQVVGIEDAEQVLFGQD